MGDHDLSTGGGDAYAVPIELFSFRFGGYDIVVVEYSMGHEGGSILGVSVCEALDLSSQVICLCVADQRGGAVFGVSSRVCPRTPSPRLATLGCLALDGGIAWVSSCPAALEVQFPSFRTWPRCFWCRTSAALATIATVRSDCGNRRTTRGPKTNLQLASTGLHASRHDSAYRALGGVSMLDLEQS